MKAMKLRLTLIKSGFMAILILNFFLPIFEPKVMGVVSLFQWILVFVHFIGMLNSTGYFTHWIPLVPWFVVRLLEIAYYTFVSGRDLSWTIFSVVLVVDVLYFILLLETKSNYKFVRE